MCGIVGFIDYKRNVKNPISVLNKMNETLTNRGPDEEGKYLSYPAYLAHKRLIVIDPVRW